MEDSRLAWDTAIAGDEPIDKYEIFTDNEKIGEVLHLPQISKKPFVFEGVEAGKNYVVAAVDKIGRVTKSAAIIV